jgi:tetratricopeptide (TPR) repeat protein
LYGDLGQSARGIEVATLAHTNGEKIAPVMYAYTSAALAHLHVLNGDPGSAQPIVDGALARMQTADPNPLFDTPIHGAQAELYLARGEYARAIESCDRAAEFLRASRLRHYLANMLYLKGLAEQRQGNLVEAFGCLQDAKGEAEHSGSRWMLWRILAALVDIEAGRGNPAQAQTLQAQSRENLNYIIAHTPNKFRATFLNLPEVRKVIGDKQNVGT